MCGKYAKLVLIKKYKNIKKKVLSLLFLIIILFSNNLSLADDIDEDLNFDWVYKEILDVSSNNINEPKVYSRNAVVFCRNSKSIVWSKDENIKVPMASTTKIMTAIILLENGNLNQIVTVCKEAGAIGGSRLGLKTNDTITINDLFYGLMLCSRK